MTLRSRLRKVRARARVAKRKIARHRKVLKVSRARIARIVRQIKDRRRALAEANQWGGSRAVTNHIIEIVGDAIPVTSRKRSATDPLSIANPDSDHSAQSTQADAVDFGTAENFALRDMVMMKLGASGPIQDYGHYIISYRFRWWRRARRFRVQPIAGTHGTGPHLHFGVKRI